MTNQVPAPLPAEESVIEERVHLLGDEENLEDIDDLLDAI